MTQGFPPGQQPPQGYAQAAQPQYQQPHPQQPQQYQHPQQAPAYPGGYQQLGVHPQPGVQAPKKESGSRGWLVALGVFTLVLPVYAFASQVVASSMDLTWLSLVFSTMGSIIRLILPLAGVAVMFRSVVARWIIVVSSAALILLTAFAVFFGQYNSNLALLGRSAVDEGFLPSIVPLLVVLVLALLPPVNHAFGNSSSGARHGQVGYAAQAVYPPYPGYPQSPQLAQAYPGGYPQVGAQAPQKESQARGWLIALGVLTLVLPVYGSVSQLVAVATDLDWMSITWSTAAELIHLVLPLAGVAVMFRSVVARWILVGASIVLTVLIPVAELREGGDIYDIDWDIFVLLLPIAVLVLAFLPPVNRAFRKSPSGAGQMPPAYAGQPMQPQQAAAHGYAQQPQPPQQPGYPNQPWQAQPQQQQPPQQPQQYPPR